MRRLQLPHWLLCSFGSLLLMGCGAMPGAAVYDTAALVYATGARQQTVAVELSVAPPDVFGSMSRVVALLDGATVLHRDDDAMELEISIDGMHLTGKVTDLGNRSTLLYIWADAGNTGQSGKELALKAVERICEDLGVTYKLMPSLSG